MKKKKLSDALDRLDAHYIDEAAGYKALERGRGWIKYASAAACLLLATAIGLGLYLKPDESRRGISPYPIRQVDVTRTEDGTELGIIPKWEDMHITSQYGEFEHALGRFFSGAKAIDADKLGESRGRVYLRGSDVYTNTEYYIEGETFVINGISEKFALALRFDGTEKYYVYRNVWYRPDTLGELIDALALTEHLEARTVYYDYVSDEGKHAKVEFEGLAMEKVWELLLSDRALENVYDQQKTYAAKMSISVNVPIVGYDNVGLWVTEDGYLVTNVGGTGKAFYLGTERVNAFIRYVMDNCQGYEIVYSYPDGYEVPESGVDHNGFEVTVQTTEAHMPE